MNAGSWTHQLNCLEAAETRCRNMSKEGCSMLLLLSGPLVEPCHPPGLRKTGVSLLLVVFIKNVWSSQKLPYFKGNKRHLGWQQQKKFTLKKRRKLAQSDHSLMKGGCRREEKEKRSLLEQKPGFTSCLTITYLVSLFPVSQAGLTSLMAVVAVGVSHCKSSSHFLTSPCRKDIVPVFKNTAVPSAVHWEAVLR